MGTSELTTFELEDYDIGRRLGRGSFSAVHSFRRRRRQQNKEQKLFEFDLGSTECTSSAAPDITHSSNSISSGSSHHQEASERSTSLVAVPIDKPLVIKRLLSTTLDNDKIAEKAARDLRNEVAILSSLPSHPNIIRLYGVSTDFWSNDPNSFLVLEKLRGTLHDALKTWRSHATSHSSKNSPIAAFKNLFEKDHWQSQTSQAERIQRVGVGIARALSFLHNKLVLFRDLKPTNVGFDKHGNVRLFDFASSRCLKHRDAKSLHRSGTLRYMAPEVARREPYSLSADVYSFGVVLAECTTLEKPYEKAETKDQLNALVTKPNKHPLSVKLVKSKHIKHLLIECWNEDPQGRPSFKRIVSQLTKELKK